MKIPSLYSKEIMKHFKNPRNVGVIKNPDGIGRVGNIQCGDIMELYIKIKKDKKGKERIADVKFQTFGCLPSDEKVVVKEGDWLNISSISTGMPVLNSNGNVTIVSDTNKRLYKGILLKFIPFVSPYNSFLITPEHPILTIKRTWLKSARRSSKECDWLRINEKELLSTKPEYIEARNLEESDYLVFVVNKKIKDNSLFTREAMRLIGYYLSEGYISAKDSVVAFAFNKNEKKAISEVKHLIYHLTNKKAKERIRKNVCEVYVCSRKLAKFLYSSCGKIARNKKLSEEILILPFEKQREIIKTFFIGDGYSVRRRPHESLIYRLATASETLAIQLQEILARGGIFSSIKKVFRDEHLIEGRKIRKSILYEISFKLKRSRSKFVHYNKKYFLVPIKKIGKKYFNGEVFNFEVEREPNSYLVKGFVVHNCVVALAVSSMLTEMVKGKTLEEATKITNKDILKKSGPVPPIKIHCSILAADALHESVYDYLSKNKRAIQESLQKEHERIQNTLKQVEKTHKEFTEFEEKILKK